MLLATPVHHFTGTQAGDASTVSAVLATLSLDGSFLLVIFVFLRMERITWADAFGFKTPGLGRALFLGIIIALCFLPIGLLLRYLSDTVLQYFNVQTQDQQAVETLKNSVPGWGRAYLVFFAIVVAPVAEESFFRGILYPFIKQSGFPRGALWGSSFAFALIHQDVPTFIPLMVLALCLAVLYEKTNNLLACITAHSVFNAANVILLWITSSINQPPY